MFLFKSAEKENKKIVDIHTHILPGIDDGAKDIEESIEMLRIAEKNGITDIILTPHYKKFLNGLDFDRVRKEFNRLDVRKTIYGININLYLGCETMFFSDLNANDIKGLGINGTNYILLEFEPGVTFKKLYTDIVNLRRSGVGVILAHAERYGCLLDDFKNIESLIEEEVLIQVNARSVITKENKRVFTFVNKLLKKEYVDFIATDCHDTEFRRPDIKQCIDFLYKKYKHDYVDAILYKNAQGYLGVK